MDKLIEKVKAIKELNELIGAVTHMCSNRDDNLVILALKQHKTNIFREAQDIADGILNPKNDNNENLEINTNKKSKKGA